MESERKFTVDIIKSENGITIYSTTDSGNFSQSKLDGEYRSFEDAHSQLTQTVNGLHTFSNLFNFMTKAEVATGGLFIAKDVIDAATNHAQANGFMPVLIMGTVYCITKLVETLNSDFETAETARLLTLREARDANLPQYERVFPT